MSNICCILIINNLVSSTLRHCLLYAYRLLVGQVTLGPSECAIHAKGGGWTGITIPDQKRFSFNLYFCVDQSTTRLLLHNSEVVWWTGQIFIPNGFKKYSHQWIKVFKVWNLLKTERTKDHDSVSWLLLEPVLYDTGRYINHH